MSDILRLMQHFSKCRCFPVFDVKLNITLDMDAIDKVMDSSAEEVISNNKLISSFADVRKNMKIHCSVGRCPQKFADNYGCLSVSLIEQIWAVPLLLKAMLGVCNIS